MTNKNFQSIEQNNDNLILFHQLLLNKLRPFKLKDENQDNEFKIRCARSKELLKEGKIPYLEDIYALHQPFIQYNNKNAVNFIILDVDNQKMTLQKIQNTVDYKLNGIKPSWLLQTKNGFHIGFILEKPIWYRQSENLDDVQKMIKVKQNLLALFNGDSIATMRNKSIMRNPLANPSIYTLNEFNLNQLLSYTNELSPQQLSLFQDLEEIKEQIEKSEITPEKIQNNQNKNLQEKWDQVKEDGNINGNRNNFIFSIGLNAIYNGNPTDTELLEILDSENKKADNPIEPQELLGIHKSVINFTKNKNYKKYTGKKYYENKSRDKEEWKQGPFWEIFNELEINNYKEQGKEIFIRQQIGQVITTIKRNEKTITEILHAMVKVRQSHKIMNNDNIVANMNKSKRTLQRYNNDKGLKEKLIEQASVIWLKNLYMPNDTPIEITHILLENINFSYKNNTRTISFAYNRDSNLILYEQEQQLVA